MIIAALILSAIYLAVFSVMAIKITTNFKQYCLLCALNGIAVGALFQICFSKVL
jgi:hypothetical protein